MDRLRSNSLRTKYRKSSCRPSKKNVIRSRYGKIEISKSNTFSEPFLGSRTSPYLQEKLALLGCENIFNAVPKVVDSLLGIEVNETQVYRICQAVSLELLDSQLDKPSEGLEKIENNKKERVYGMIDGSMLQMEQGWQETKVGRVFKAEMIENSDSLKWQIAESEYVANRGHCSAFISSTFRL